MTLNECLIKVHAAVKTAQEQNTPEAVIDRRALIFLEAYIDETTCQLEYVRNKIKTMIYDLKKETEEYDISQKG